MLEVIYEDEHCIAINKPNGLLVHRTRIAAEEKSSFAMQMLRDQIGQHVFPVHRLDRPTSGVLLFGKDKEVAHLLSKTFEHREVRKQYLTVVRGYAPEEGEIDYPLKKEGEGEKQEAITFFKRLQTVELPIAVGRYQTARYSLLNVQPLTGRMHQIRRHFAHIRHYIVGDKRHGDWRHNQMFAEQLDSPFLLLHAHSINFVHPYYKTTTTIEAP
ncbi:pseudouridine synthase, partial [Xanthovirga aplysinae]|uniref:pseudouridine synthase n=1 Tax=Xanthovirga aplysinae TaxID=2529853 RepID=UPI0012BC50BD